MDQAENFRDNPQGLTDLDLGGQPRPARENDFNPDAHFGAWGGEGAPTASLADVVPPLPNDSFGAGNEFETGGERPVPWREISSVESGDLEVRTEVQVQPGTSLIGLNMDVRTGTQTPDKGRDGPKAIGGGKNVPQQQSHRDPREIQGHSRQNILPPNPPRAWTQFPDGGRARKKKRRIPCVYCQGNHPLWLCNWFLDQSVAERLRIVLSKNCCQVCLGHQNHGDNCSFRAGRLCGLNGCRQRHHRLIHPGAAVEIETLKSDLTSLRRELQAETERRKKEESSRVHLRTAKASGSQPPQTEPWKEEIGKLREEMEKMRQDNMSQQKEIGSLREELRRMRESRIIKPEGTTSGTLPPPCQLPRDNKAMGDGFLQKEFGKLREELTQQSTTRAQKCGALSGTIKGEAARLVKPTSNKPITHETGILDRSRAPPKKTVVQIQPKEAFTNQVIGNARSQMTRRWSEICQRKVEEVSDPPVDFWDDQIQKRCLLLHNARDDFLRIVRAEVGESGSDGDTIVEEISRHRKETDGELSAHRLVIRQKILEQKESMEKQLWGKVRV